jgi:hypothetical protein
MTIDMRDYAGELESPAAVEQQVELNSYQRESLGEELNLPEVPANQAPFEKESQQPVTPEPTSQELNFKALAESVEKLKAEKEAEKREYQLQLDMLRANLSKQPQSAAQDKKMFDGMDDSDIPTVGELRKAWQERETGYNEKIEELQVANMHSDYAEVLGKYGKHLAETDPLFLQGIKSAENKALFAYQYAKREQELQTLREAMKTQTAAPQPQQSAVAQKIVENARKPGTLAQAGGQSTLSQVDYYSGMSDVEFMKFASKHLEAI